MFTGLVKEIGKVKKITPNREGLQLMVESKILLPEIAVDDSVAINGVCQTATAISDSSFTVQVVHSSLQKTTLGSLKVGDEVNLELALRLSDRLGGHLVQGHVNDKVVVSALHKTGDNVLLTVELPENQARYVIKEGSITLDGVSLTVSQLEGHKATVSLIPHTYYATVLRNRKIGDAINLEVDVLAKYIERLLTPSSIQSEKVSITEDWLRSKGF